MNTRKLIGVVAFSLLLSFGLAGRCFPELSLENWQISWKLGYIFAVCVALFSAFYDQKNFSDKMWDFNPRRGLLYFFCGWIIFPMTIAVEIIFGTEITLSRILLGTLGLSVLLGILGTFTENVGV